jgi:UDP-N-acetyl-D-mannosaminuronate dehydrogenase
MGEIGRPIFEIIEENSEYNVYGEDLDVKKCSPNIQKLPRTVDIIHICIPCTDMQKFIKVVTSYYKRYKPKMIIINSTVIPRTTEFIADVLQSDCFIAHSPMFGTHNSKDDMKEQFMFYPHVIGGVNDNSAKVISDYYLSLNSETVILKSSLESEIMKIMETTYAGWLITYFVEFHRLAVEMGADYEDIVRSMMTICGDDNNKPIWYPSVIEGHCIMQNIDLLLKIYDAGFLRFIKDSNEFRREEIKYKQIKDSVEKIKEMKRKAKWERK